MNCLNTHVPGQRNVHKAMLGNTPIIDWPHKHYVSFLLCVNQPKNAQLSGVVNN